jgi:TetR/AcrR family transcriptional regulator, repressor of fatR-cypB operon
MKQNKDENQDTRMRIFMAAAELISIYGYCGVSIRQICEAVGVGKPTLYYYFKDKEALLEQLYQFAFDQLKEITAELIAENHSFFGRLRALITLRQIFSHRFPNFFRFFISSNVSSLPDSAKKLMVDHFNWVFESMKTFIDEGKKEGDVNPGVPTHLIVHSLLGALNQITFRHIYLENQEMITDQDAEELFDFWKKHLFNYSKERSDT